MIKIHLVEDNSKLVELIREALEKAQISHTLRVSSNGEEALYYLKNAKTPPHLILLDLNLPKKTGFEVLDVVKKDPALRPIPIIILTSSDTQEDILRAYSHHCNAYVRKPAEFDKVVKTIQSICTFWVDVATLPQTLDPTPVPPPPPPPKF